MSEPKLKVVSARFAGGLGPTVDQLQDGDLLWPRAKDEVVPYVIYPGGDITEDKRAWESGKELFFRQLEEAPAYFSEEQLQRLRHLTYEDFRKAYDTAPNPAGPSDSALRVKVAVGHVAIVEIKDGGSANIIEAVWGDIGRVRSIAYTDWSASYSEDLVWLGRVSGYDSGARSRVSGEASKYIGRPYNFWNLDLADTSAFYCSKLVWLAIRDGLGFAIDGDSNPKRAFWFSPKQLINEPGIELIVDPEPYFQ